MSIGIAPIVTIRAIANTTQSRAEQALEAIRQETSMWRSRAIAPLPPADRRAAEAWTASTIHH